MSRAGQRRYRVALCTIHVFEQWVTARSDEQAETLAEASYDKHGLAAFKLAFYEVDHYQVSPGEESGEVQP